MLTVSHLYFLMLFFQVPRLFQIHDVRSLKSMMASAGKSGAAEWVPEWVRIPLWLIHMKAYKF